MQHRAYTFIDIKSIDEETRTIEGIASTPRPDRVGDVVESSGVHFKTPLPLLLDHNSTLQVGHVNVAKATDNQITFKATIVKVAEAGEVRDLVDKAWQLVKYKLRAAVSIGFRALDGGVEIMKNGGYRFTDWEWLELSLVTIPAQPDALLHTSKGFSDELFNEIKSIDTTIRAATGIKDGEGRPAPPGAAGTKTHKPVNLKPKEGKKVNIKEQIAALEKKRDEHNARRMEIQKGASDAGRTKTEAESEEFKNLGVDLESIKAELSDLAELDVANLKTLKPAAGASADEGGAARQPGRTIEVRGHNLAKGVPFIRMVSALAQSKGNRFEAAQIADRWKDSTPEVASVLKMPLDLIERTAVNAGTTTDSTWAAPLAQYTNLASEFIDYLRPLTIIGRISGFRRVPFMTKVPRQTSGASVNWVGQGKVKPVSSLAFDSLTLDPAKVAGIIPMTEELLRLSSPSAELLVRDDLAAAITQFLDSEFIDPTNASTDVSPASVTYGVSPITATGTTASAFRADVKSMLAGLLVANLQISGGTWVMTQQQAVGLSLMQTASGSPEFPGITPSGGTLLGFPVVTSENVPSMAGSPADGYYIVFLLPGEILLADDGGVTIDISREASLQMETTPDSPVTASTNLVSLWQHNMVAIKAERYINWLPRRSVVAGVIQGAKYAE